MHLIKIEEHSIGHQERFRTTVLPRSPLWSGFIKSRSSIQVPFRNLLPNLAQLLAGLLILLNRLSRNKTTLTEQSDRCIKYQNISKFIKNPASHMEKTIHFPSQRICGERISFSDIHSKIRSRETEIYKCLIWDGFFEGYFKAMTALYQNTMNVNDK